MTVPWDSGALGKKGKTHTVCFLSSAAFHSQQLLLAAGRKPDGGTPVLGLPSPLPQSGKTFQRLVLTILTEGLLNSL